ncbi:membrane protein [Microbacterium phage Zooman]|nr:membrane protein [Microbacterium phage Zooman]
MKSIRQFWHNSPPEQKDYLFIYSWGALWALVYLIFPPTSTLSVFSGTLVALWAGVTILGGVVGVYGLVSRDNLIVERFGVNLLMIGPLAFALTQLGLLVFGIIVPVADPLNRLHLIFYALWPYLFLNKRRRQLKARIKLVKRIPLISEEKK